MIQAELAIALILPAFIGGMFLAKYLINPLPKNETLQYMLWQIAVSLKESHDLKYMYIVTHVLGSRTTLWFKVQDFGPLHFKCVDGRIFPYSSMSGYIDPPQEIIDKIKNDESNLHVVRTNQIIK